MRDMAAEWRNHGLRCCALVLALGPVLASFVGTAAETETSNNIAPAKVTKVYGEIAPGNNISVMITNLLEWSRRSKDNDATKLLPFINGRQLNGLFPSATYIRTGRIAFHLAITELNKDAWTDLLRRPTSFRRPVSFTVGLEGDERFDTVYRFGNKDLYLTLMSPPWAVASVLVVGLTGVILISLSRRTGLIRDPAFGLTPAEKDRPYNLGRAQMAFWFFLILTSYVGLWLITGSLETITPSILALMGISAGTALGDALIDANKRASKNAQIRSSVVTTERIEREGHTVEKQATTVAIDSHSENDRISRGFLKDLLSDGNGYSFHRFQIFAWTLVLGVIFVASVYDGLHMPEFNSTLLALMGLSAGTYVTLKLPEISR
jgi:hypothetical protein